MNAEIYDLSDYNFKSFEEYIMKNTFFYILFNK